MGSKNLYHKVHSHFFLFLLTALFLWTFILPQIAAAPPMLQSPTNLIATPGVNQVSLSWSASSNAQCYKVYRSTVSGYFNMLIISSQDAFACAVGDPVGTTYSDATANGGTTYYYALKAIASNFNPSGFSNQVSATPTTTTTSSSSTTTPPSSSSSSTTTTTPPTVPSKPLNVQASIASVDQASISWSAPTSDGGSAIICYQVYTRNYDGTGVFKLGGRGTCADFDTTPLTTSFTYTNQLFF